MKVNVPIVLGLDPGSRQIGISVFRGGELLSFGVKTIQATNQKGAIAKMHLLIEKLILEYEINYAAIENTISAQQRRTFVKTVAEDMVTFLSDRGICCVRFHPRTVRQLVCEGKKPTKANAVGVLGTRFPELDCYAKRRRTWQRRYYASLFDAVAVGWVASQEIRPTKRT